MNFYVLRGTRADTAVLKLVLDKTAQGDLSQMLGSRATEMATGEHTKFASGYRPDEDEIISLSPYALPEMLTVLTDAECAAALPEIKHSDLEEGQVRAVVGVDWKGQHAQAIAFQRIDSRYLLRQERWRFVLAGGRLVHDDRVGIQIAERVDAAYVGNTLYISSWPRAHSVLDLS